MDLVHELVHALRNTRQRRGQVAPARKLSELLFLAAARRQLSTQPELSVYELHEAFLAAGGMQGAVRLLTSTQQAGTLEAAELLKNACLVPEAAAELVAAGGVEPLVQLLVGTEASRTRAAAVCALADAAGWSDAVQTAAVAAGCVPLVLAVFQQAAADLQPLEPVHERFKSGELLCTLARNHADILLACGAVAALVSLVPSDPIVCSTALKALGQLAAACCARRGEAAAAIAATSSLPSLARCLRGGGGLYWPDAKGMEFTVPQLAAGLLGDMADACPQLAADIEAAGGVTKLEWMLRNSTHSDERGWAATALAHIRRAAASAAGGSGAAPEAADAPAAAAPKRTCAAPGCGNTRGLRSCGGCHVVRYCSPACCKAHWLQHKAECRRLQAKAAAAAAVEPEP